MRNPAPTDRRTSRISALLVAGAGLAFAALSGCLGRNPTPHDPEVLILKPFPERDGTRSPATQPEELERQLIECVNRINVGMRRQEVEQMLPRPATDGYISAATITGGAQGVRYLVAPGYWVLVFYDYTGVPRDGAGTALATSSPDNRVLQKPELQRDP